VRRGPSNRNCRQGQYFLRRQPGSIVLFVAFLVLLATQALAQTSEPTADKSQFTLQNPTPRALMREMATDRPDTTESPITVDAGHWQLEMSFFDYATDGDANTFVLAPFNLKVGLTNDTDVQLVVEPFINQERPHASGVGDLTVRLKYNLWGNDGGDTALALLPYLTFPTASGGVGVEGLEGGLAVPFSMSLPNDWELGLMGQIDFVRDEGDDHYTVNFLHTAVVSHDIVGDLAGYIEVFGIIPHNSGGGYQPYLSTGLTYAVSEDIQLDGGVRIGLSDSAEDFGLFTGLSLRF
jgi:hypothetical protein